MSAASVAYLGPFIRSYRDQMTKDWLAFCQDYGVFTSAKYGLIKTMGNGNQVSLKLTFQGCELTQNLEIAA